MAFLFPNVVANMRLVLFLATGVVLMTIFMPVMWHMWLYPGIVNANHFYFQNLGYIIMWSFGLIEYVRTAVKIQRGRVGTNSVVSGEHVKSE